MISIIEQALGVENEFDLFIPITKEEAWGHFN